jgi:hypothetical protein
LYQQTINKTAENLLTTPEKPHEHWEKVIGLLGFELCSKHKPHGTNLRQTALTLALTEALLTKHNQE